MHVDAHDTRPPSLLLTGGLRPASALAGSAVSVGAHAGVLLLLVLMGKASQGTDAPKSYIDEHVVAAEFVQLGKPPDPKKLPQRKVPRKTTAPKDSVAVSKDMDPPKPEKKKDEPPPEAEEDLLTRLGDRAKAFAEIAEAQEREGDPEGIEDGTATEAKAGNLYLGKLKAFFQRGWTIPQTLTDTDGLLVVATVELTLDGHVGPHRIVRGSGVPLFDQSVEDRFNQLRAQGTSLPEPPPEVAGDFLGQKITIRFRDER